jgi:TolB-like protein/DNA-binding winged helix-turn-helix (wHTH) protein
VATSPFLASPLRFGPFDLDPRVGELRRSGVRIRLSPQPFKLLALLASRAGEVVTREDIRSLLWGTDTFVDFEQGVNHCIRSIRAVLGHGPGSPVYIETVPGRGYRFVAPVQGLDGAAPSTIAGAATVPLELHFTPLPQSRRSRAAWAGMTRWLGRWFGRLRPRSAPDATVRLAVLPFDDLTGVAALSGGLTDEISTHLSRALEDRLQLVSSSSAKLLKETPDPVGAARHSGVDFLLEGSVRSSAARARVNAHLVRVSDEIQLWTESYERPLQDVFDFQTDVARAIAAGARGRLVT